MTKSQEDILKMYESVSNVLHTHQAVWAANVPFTDAVGALDAGIVNIGSLRSRQGVDFSGVIEDKDQRRLALEDQAHAAASILVFYASVSGNRELLAKVNFTRTQLDRARDNELPGMSEQVHQEAVAHAAAVLPFGLTAAMTTALRTAIDDFVDYISKPRAAKSETSAATNQLLDAYTATDKILEERLDKGMEIYKSSTNFYAQYFIARIIINSPRFRRALEATFIDDATGTPLRHVNVLIDHAISRSSSEKGTIRVQSLSEGAHTLAASLTGYVNVNKHFNVIAGETTKMEIRMVRG